MNVSQEPNASLLTRRNLTLIYALSIVIAILMPIFQLNQGGLG